MKVLAYGEVLWDIIETRKEIGGAPFNFCAHISKLCCNAYLISAVGSDSLGAETIEMLNKFRVKKDFVKVLEHPTGSCRVVCDSGGQPEYVLKKDVAWDFITADDNLYNRISSNEFELFYFGTLAARSKQSAETLNNILSLHNFRYVFCDLNFRQNFYSRECIESSLNNCNILKLNREELFVLSDFRIISIKGKQNTDKAYKSACRQLAERYSLKLILLTLDKDGALIFDADKNNFHSAQKPQNTAVSCVGAGDSFSACFLANFLFGNPIDVCANRATLLSDYVVTQYGAVPEYTPQLIDRILPARPVEK